jgi:hypothetical protein
MKTRLGITTAVLLAISVSSAFAYLITPWSYADLFAKSDFVVIATPLTAPRDTSERMTLQDISPPVRVIGVTTEFQTLFVLKGSRRQRFKLHHYREPPPKPNVIVMGGPALATFDPAKGRKRYLLFLVREADGRFAPVSGQKDPANISVQEVFGDTDDN